MHSDFKNELSVVGDADTLAALRDRATALWEQGDYAEARVLEENVLDQSLKLLGENHLDTLTVNRRTLLLHNRVGKNSSV